MSGVAGASLIASQFSGEAEQPLPLGVKVGFGFFLLLAYFVFGMGGAAFAALVARPFASERRPDKPSRFRPWHIGRGVAVAELIAVTAVSLAVR